MQVTVLSHPIQRMQTVPKRHSLFDIAIPFMSRTAGFGLAALLVMAISVSANSQLANVQEWVRLSPKTHPSSRFGMLTAFEASNRTVVLYGGLNANDQLSDTWVWNGKNWTQQHPKNNPGPASQQGGMACEEAEGKVVLVKPAADDKMATWVWDGENWTQEHPKNSPPVRLGAAMAYNAINGTVVMFGGFDSHGNLSETWLWNGTNWTEEHPQDSPPARYFHAMASDGSNAVILFGGQGKDQEELSDTWVWNGDNWLEKHPKDRPSARVFSAMAFDPRLGVAVLFGGEDYSNTVVGDTWLWDGTNWTKGPSADSPSPRLYSSLAYDAGTDDLVLFGGEGNNGLSGLSDTWTWPQYAAMPIDATDTDSATQEE
jgi:hypothetical protein